MSRYCFRLADQNDNQQLLERLECDHINGQVQIIFRRRPDYFLSLRAGSKYQQVLVVQDRETDRIIGCASRTVRPVYLNGHESYIGYLSDLRLDEKYRNGVVLARGFKYLESLRQDQKAAFYLTTIIDDNLKAKEALANGRKILPQYIDFGAYYTWLVALGQYRVTNTIPSIEVERGSENNLQAIVEFINKTGRDKQFYPHCALADFQKSNDYFQDLCIDDFYLAVRNGEIVGVLAKWDQRKYKQTCIKGYQGGLRYSRHILNFGLRLRGLRGFPAPGTEMNYFSICFIANKDNNADIFQLLLTHLYNDNISKVFYYMIVGLHELDPLNEVMKQFICLKYVSRLYLVTWENKAEEIVKLDCRIPYMEVASL